jgi:tetratricopeptide (TPR) repeat protein
MTEPQKITRLFAVEAEKLLAAGQAQEAVQLCEAGLAQFPDYPTAYGILARAYHSLGDSHLASDAISRGLKRFPLQKYLLRLRDEFPAPQIAEKEEILKSDEAEKAVEVLKIEESSKIEEVLKTDEIVEKDEILKADDDLIIDEEVISEEDVEAPVELEADPAVIEVSEEEAEKELKEFEEVFKNDEPEDLIVDEEVISEEDVENPAELEADPAVIEVSEADAEEEREEFEEVFKNDKTEDYGAEEIPEEEVLKENSMQEFMRPLHVSETRYSPLRIVETFKSDEPQRKSLKSASIRLIPGLEFAPLRFESSKKYNRHIASLPEPPQFRAFKTMQRVSYTSDLPSMFQRMENLPLKDQVSGNLIQRRAQEAGFVAQNLTPLEELATRLEKARIPVVKEDIDPQSSIGTREPSVVTDTMAKIYEMQGALTEALKAYQVLARQKPEKLEYYEGKIQEIQQRLSE